MSALPADPRPASLAVKAAADALMLRWADGSLGSTDANDAALLGHLNTLDFIGEQLGEIEADAFARHAPGSLNGGHGKRARRFWRRLLSSFVSHA